MARDLRRTHPEKRSRERSPDLISRTAKRSWLDTDIPDFSPAPRRVHNDALATSPDIEPRFDDSPTVTIPVGVALLAPPVRSCFLSKVFLASCGRPPGHKAAQWGRKEFSDVHQLLQATNVPPSHRAHLSWRKRTYCTWGRWRGTEQPSMRWGRKVLLRTVLKRRCVARLVSTHIMRRVFRTFANTLPASMVTGSQSRWSSVVMF